MQKKYIVRLTAEERTELEAMVKKGKAAAYKIKHANILLAADVEGLAWPDRQIAEAFSCHVGTVENVRRRPWNVRSRPSLRTLPNSMGRGKHA